MQSWQGKSKGIPLGYRIFVFILKKLGVYPAYILLRFVALYYYLFSWKSSKHIYNFYHRVLGFGRFNSLMKLYKNYCLLGQTIIDKVVVMGGIPNRFTFNFDGEDNLRKIVAQKKGGLLISAHLGNWEVAGHLFTRLQTRINVVMYDGEHQQIKDYMDSVTGKRNINVIVIKNDLSHIYAIHEALSNNEMVCMHADRFIEGNKTITASFLGKDARFPMGPFVLAAKFKVPVSFVFAMKESNLHYHFFSSEIKDYSAVEKDKLIAAIAHDFVLTLEGHVKNYPEQWFNYYNFWK